MGRPEAGEMSSLRYITESLADITKTESICLSGSRKCAINDDASDWDIYVYSSCRIMPEERECIFDSMFPHVSVNCSPFEEGDECIDKDGNVFDIMYRSLEWTEREVDDVYRHHNARVGYTTCFLHNISTSEILFDRNGWFKRIQDEINSGYPEELRTNIIRKNARVINGSGASTFMIQAELAKKRHDIVSSNHRLTAILSSYFDILFAYNRTYHPGEKKLLQYAHLLKDFPPDMDEDIERAIQTVANDGHIKALKTLIGHLYDFLQS